MTKRMYIVTFREKETGLVMPIVFCRSEEAAMHHLERYWQTGEMGDELGLLIMDGDVEDIKTDDDMEPVIQLLAKSWSYRDWRKG